MTNAEKAREIIRDWDKKVSSINALMPCMPYGSLEKLITQALDEKDKAGVVLPSEEIDEERFFKIPIKLKKDFLMVCDVAKTVCLIKEMMSKADLDLLGKAAKLAAEKNNAKLKSKHPSARDNENT